MGEKTIRRVVPRSNISRIADAVASVLGTEAVHRGDTSDQGEPRVFIPSGVPGLDAVLDRKGRGWPGGRIVEVYGASATCKTGIAYALIAQVQKAGGDAVLYPCEGNWDAWLAEQYGVDPNRLVLADDETVEGVGESLQKLLETVGRSALLAVVVDSVAGLSTRAELADEEYNRDRAAQVRAMLLSKLLRKLGARIPRTNVILFLINQTREGTEQNEKPKPTGGRAIGFYCSIRLRLELIEKVWRQIAGKKRVAGFKLRATSEKNRLARPFESAVVMLDFDRGLRKLDVKKAKKL